MVHTFAPLWTLDFIHTQNHIFTSDLKVEARLSGEQRKLKGVGTRDKGMVVGYEELCLKHSLYLDHNDLVQLNIIITIKNRDEGVVAEKVLVYHVPWIQTQQWNKTKYQTINIKLVSFCNE